MKPALSVVVPIYNVEQYLEKCLASVVDQSFTDFEVILVNDGSSDSSAEIAQRYVLSDNRFRLISQENRGLGGARNTGIADARGEYLFLLDSDDYILPNAFEDLIAYARQNGLDLVVFDYDRVDDKGAFLSTTCFGDGVVPKDKAFRNILSLKTSPQAWNKLYKTSLFTVNNISYPEHFLHEDIPVTYRLFWSAGKIGYLAQSYYCWLVRNDSITQNFGYKHINDVADALMEIKQYLHEKSIFSTYESEYIECSVKMFNLLLKRTLQHGMFGCMDYLLFTIDSRKIVADSDVNSLEKVNDRLLREYKANYDLVDRRRTECFEKPSSKVVTRKVFSANMHGSIVPSYMRKIIYKCSYVLFPLGSRRRANLKRFLGR